MNRMENPVEGAGVAGVENDRSWGKEMVIAVARSAVFPDGTFQGFCRDLPSAVWRSLSRGYRLIPRSRAETDPSFKQLIPYVVVKGESGYFLYRRLSTGAESRLRGRYSIGVGGHLVESDLAGRPGKSFLAWPGGDHLPLEGGLLSALVAGLERELQEEMEFPGGLYPVRFLGLVNDETVPVARVHLGLVFQVDVGDRIPLVAEAESHIIDGRFAAAPEVMNNWVELESWSQIVARYLLLSKDRRVVN